jgi:hypothetical protein
MRIVTSAVRVRCPNLNKFRRTARWVTTLGIILCAQNAFALVPAAGWGYTIGWSIQRFFGGPPDGWIGWWDPPANVIRGRVTFVYDPTLITIQPSRSGFLAQFSDNPSNVLPWDPSEHYPDWDTGTNPLGGPRPGGTATLSLVGTNKVVLNFDFSANPPSASDSSSTNFYGLAFATNQPLQGWTVNNTNTGQLHEVGSLADQSETFMVCSTGSGEYSCGETNSASVGFGLTSVPTPEPTSAVLLAMGVIGTATLLRRR